MHPALNKPALIAFQDDIQQRFLAAEVRHPIHLCDLNQIDHLLPIFEQIQEQDWLFTSYRGIFHWLLKGVSPDELRAAIIRQGTMGFCDKERRIVSSAIVGGQLPIALGMAMGLQNRALAADVLPPNVWVFLGDMAAETGAFLEATKYAGQHGLPVTFVIEDNGLSTNTPTQKVWGYPPARSNPERIAREYGASVIWYGYQRNIPHVGVGSFVTFS